MIDLRSSLQRVGHLGKLPISRWPRWAWALLALTLLAALVLPALAAPPLQPAAPLPAQSHSFGGQASSAVALSLGVLFKLGIVVLLIYVSLYLLKRWGFGASSRPQKRLVVLETARLSPRQALHLVRVEEQTLLIGATDQAIALISQVGSLPVETAEVDLPVENLQPEAKSAAGFAELLVSATGKR